MQYGSVDDKQLRVKEHKIEKKGSKTYIRMYGEGNVFTCINNDCRAYVEQIEHSENKTK